MKWFDDWFAKKSKEAWENSRGLVGSDLKALTLSGYNVAQQPMSPPTPSPGVGTQSINFQIYPATGGHVVEVHFVEASSYQINGTVPKKSLHVIPSEYDLGDAISKIITLEMLKK